MRGRILFLSDTASIHTQRWIEAFGSSDYDVTVATLRSSGATSRHPNVRIECVSNPRLKKAGYLFALPKIRKLHREGNFDLVHAHHLSSYGFLGSFLPRTKPFFATAWGSDVLVMPQRNQVYRYLARRSLEAADLVITTAQNVSDTIPSITQKHGEIKCIPFGVDVEAFGFRQPRQQVSQFRILSNRAFKPIYDIQTLIDACAKINGKLDFKVTLAGAGPQEGDLRKRVADCGLNDSIEFAGVLRTPEMIAALKSSDLFVTCSLSDSNNVSLNEAMAVGSIPIASRISANTPWISDRENGFLFTTGDSDSLAKAILEASAQQMRWPKIAEQNRQIVVERANWRRCVKEVFDIYDSHLARAH